MKVLLISDSHNYNEQLKKVYEVASYDCIIHCGDSSLRIDDPLLHDVLTVQGNHDDVFNLTESITLAEWNILVTHGHKFHIYKGYDDIVAYMKKHNYQLCFYGHTHIPHIEYIEDMILINPGSLMYNRGHSQCASYAIVSLEKGSIDVHFYNLDTGEEISQDIMKQDEELIEELKKFA